jgi:hypothetical protein
VTTTPPATFVVCQIAPAILFALSMYWTIRQNKLQQLPAPLHDAAGYTGPHSFDSQSEECEALAPYPEHVMGAARRASAASSHPARGQHDEREAWKEPHADTVSTPTAASAAPTRCPHCLSSRIETRNVARKAGSAIGSVAGATSGIAVALSGAEVGATVGAVAGPVGSLFGGLAGAIIAGLVGSAAGCAAGSAVGTAIDDAVLDNHRCLDCHHTFSVRPD